jgi:release factor glutamine methyltransferase
MEEKPDFISTIDFNLLKQMYPDKMPEIISKLKKNYPVQYLIGYVDFCGYKINVDNRVLIPRFETELLVANTIDLIKEKALKPEIIDIGTGSGCIAITLSKELHTHVNALDISAPALEVAELNATQNNADITFYHQDITNCTFTKKYNVIISNPPYVKEGTIIDPKTQYEPHNAIFAGSDALTFYDIILKKSQEILTNNSIIAFEMGDNQKEALISLAKSYYPDAYIITKKDLAGMDRYLFILTV